MNTSWQTIIFNLFNFLQACPISFKTRSALRSHKMNIHGGSNERHPSVVPFINPETKKLQCDLCSTSFTLDRPFIIHRAAHTGDKPQLPCWHCDLYFETMELLKTHTTKDHADLLISCPECPKKFMTHNYLDSHLQLHKYFFNVVS